LKFARAVASASAQPVEVADPVPLPVETLKAVPLLLADEVPEMLMLAPTPGAPDGLVVTGVTVARAVADADAAPVALEYDEPTPLVDALVVIWLSIAP
jgi:hypothetical protein